MTKQEGRELAGRPTEAEDTVMWLWTSACSPVPVKNEKTVRRNARREISDDTSRSLHYSEVTWRASKRRLRKWSERSGGGGWDWEAESYMEDGGATESRRISSKGRHMGSGRRLIMESYSPIVQNVTNCQLSCNCYTNMSYRPWHCYSYFSHRQFNIQQFYVLPTHCIYVFCVDLRTNSHYFPIQH